MLDLMGETKGMLISTTLKHWSAEAIDFLKAMSFSSLDVLSDVSVKQLCPEFLLNPLIARVVLVLFWVTTWKHSCGLSMC
jgi:hypothetical protein